MPASGGEPVEKVSDANRVKGCPVHHGTTKGNNQPIHAKKYVAKNAKPKSLQKPGESDMDKFCYTEIVDCPVYETSLDRFGKWFGPFNLVPFLNGLESIMDLIKKARTIQATNPDAPCFRTNLGVDCVLITSNTAAHWFLSLNEDSLDRDQRHMLGPIHVLPHWYRTSAPCLLTTEKDGHALMRKHWMAVIEKRLIDIDDVVERTFTYRLDQMVQGFAKDPNFLKLEDIASCLCGYFTAEWLLEVEPPCNVSIFDFGRDLIRKPSSENWFGGIFAQIFADLMRILDPDTYKREDVFIKLTRSSRYYKQYESMAKEMGIDVKYFEYNFTWTLFFTSANGLGLAFAGAVASLGENLGTVSELRKELGMDNLTIESVQDEEKYPLLDSFAWEVFRAYHRGMMNPRIALKDLIMPGGDGKAYRIKKGELLVPFYPLAMRDERVFENAHRFNPRRYLDNPEMKRHTFPFGFPSDFDAKKAPWACPAHSMGFGTGLLKVFIGKWLQRVDWCTVEPPYFNGNASGEFRPPGMPLGKLQYRQAYLDSLN